VLLSPPEESEGVASLRGHWEIPPEVAAKLAALPKDQRWQTIRRNLRLPPSAQLLWTDIADAILDTIAAQAPRARPEDDLFGLWVAFPAGPEPQVALAFDQPTEKALKQAVLATATGVEGFLELRPPSGAPDVPDEVRETVQVHLLDGDGQPLAHQAPDATGYFCFPALEAHPEFGTDYYLAVSIGESQHPSSGALDSEDYLPLLSLPGGAGSNRVLYVPVTLGTRTRVRLPAQLSSAHMPADFGIKIFGAPAAPEGLSWLAVSPSEAETLVEGFVISVLPWLQPALERAPRNPGIHVGIAVTPEDGATGLYAIRIPFRPPVPDPGPKRIPGARMRLELWRVGSEILETQVREVYEQTGVVPQTWARYYLRMSLVGAASEPSLTLTARPLVRSPWALSLGVAPAADPEIYALAASYKFAPTVDLLAGVGYQNGEDTCLVYGATLDLDWLLGRAFRSLREEPSP